MAKLASFRLNERRFFVTLISMADTQFNHPVPELTDEEDAETLAAIDRGIEDVKASRVVSLEEARAYIDQWHSKSSLPKKL
jgi:predicted transcriptional regulator